MLPELYNSDSFKFNRIKSCWHKCAVDTSYETVCYVVFITVAPH